MYGIQGGVASASASLPTEQLIGISFKERDKGRFNKGKIKSRMTGSVSLMSNA